MNSSIHPSTYLFIYLSMYLYIYLCINSFVYLCTYPPTYYYQIPPPFPHPKGPFEARIDSWNATLQTVSEVLDEWIQLQRNWLYLQPIFDYGLRSVHLYVHNK